MITAEIVVGAKGCGKSEQARQAMHLSPEQYQQHIENCKAAIEEADRRKKADEQWWALMWALGLYEGH